jgi:hypothetical protein
MMIMTLDANSQFSGIPMPITQLKMEQKFKLRRIQDSLEKISLEELKEVFLLLQEQNFILSNTVSNLVKQWPTHPRTTPEAK